MKKFLTFFVLVFLGLTIQAQEVDEVLMVVGGKSFTVGDFLHAYQKNNLQSGADMEKYLEDFKTYKMRVAYAEKQGYDTLSTVRQQLAFYQKCMEAGKPVSQEHGHEGLNGQSLYIGHLFFPLPQHAPSYNYQYNLKARMDSVYSQIQGGKDFLKVINEVSPATCNAYWISRNQTLEEFERQVFRLNEGEMSLPFLDYDGYHLVKVFRKSDNGAATGFEPVSSQQLIDTHLLVEYRDGLLLNEFIKAQGMAEQELDEQVLQKFYAANRKKYEWKIPRFKGVLYFCKDKKTMKEVAKLLKKHPMELWESLAESPVHAKLFSRVMMGNVQLYTQGQNAHVDALVFKGPKQTARMDYPYSGVSGKKFKKGPDNMADIRELVEADYLQAHGNPQMLEMIKGIPVEINMKVFKKINK